MVIHVTVFCITEVDMDAGTMSFFVNNIKMQHTVSELPHSLYLGISGKTVSFTTVSFQKLSGTTPSSVEIYPHKCKTKPQEPRKSVSSGGKPAAPSKPKVQEKTPLPVVYRSNQTEGCNISNMHCEFVQEYGYRTVFIDTELKEGVYQWNVEVDYTSDNEISIIYVGVVFYNLISRFTTATIGSKTGTCAFQFWKDMDDQYRSTFSGCGGNESRKIPNTLVVVPPKSLVCVELDMDKRTLGFSVGGVRSPHFFSHLLTPVYFGISGFHTSFTTQSFFKLSEPTLISPDLPVSFHPCLLPPGCIMPPNPIPPPSYPKGDVKPVSLSASSSSSNVNVPPSSSPKRPTPSPTTTTPVVSPPSFQYNFIVVPSSDGPFSSPSFPSSPSSPSVVSSPTKKVDDTIQPVPPKKEPEVIDVTKLLPLDENDQALIRTNKCALCRSNLLSTTAGEKDDDRSILRCVRARSCHTFVLNTDRKRYFLLFGNDLTASVMARMPPVKPPPITTTLPSPTIPSATSSTSSSSSLSSSGGKKSPSSPTTATAGAAVTPVAKPVVYDVPEDAGFEFLPVASYEDQNKLKANLCCFCTDKIALKATPIPDLKVNIPSPPGKSQAKSATYVCDAHEKLSAHTIMSVDVRDGKEGEKKWFLLFTKTNPNKIGGKNKIDVMVNWATSNTGKSMMAYKSLLGNDSERFLKNICPEWESVTKKAVYEEADKKKSPSVMGSSSFSHIVVIDPDNMDLRPLSQSDVVLRKQKENPGKPIPLFNPGWWDRVEQRQVSDCPVISTIISIGHAEHISGIPYLSGRIFPRKDSSSCGNITKIAAVNEEGLYHVKGNINGCERVVAIDDRLPWWSANKKMLTCGTADENNAEFGPSLLEKAYLQCTEHSYTLPGTLSQNVITFFGFIPENTRRIADFIKECEKIPTVNPNETINVQKSPFWQNLIRGFSTGRCMATIGTSGENDPGEGLIPGHAYSVIDAFSIPNHQGKEDFLLVRNPHHTNGWYDDSYKKIRKDKPADPNKGEFYIAIADLDGRFDNIKIGWSPSVFPYSHRLNYKYTFVEMEAAQNKRGLEPRITLNKGAEQCIWLQLIRHIPPDVIGYGVDLLEDIYITLRVREDNNNNKYIVEPYQQQLSVLVKVEDDYSGPLTIYTSVHNLPKRKSTSGFGLREASFTLRAFSNEFFQMFNIGVLNK